MINLIMIYFTIIYQSDLQILPTDIFKENNDWVTTIRFDTKPFAKPNVRTLHNGPQWFGCLTLK